MKKIIISGFIAAALAMSIVSNVEARVRQVKTQTPSTTSPRTLLADTKAMINAAPENKEKIAIKVVSDIQANPETEELASLRVERAEIIEDINLKNDELKAIAADLSWFDFSDPEYYSVKEEINGLTQELKVIDARINTIEKTQPKETIFSVKYAVAALIALGLADQLITGGEGRTALVTGVRNVGGKISTAAQAGWSYAPSLNSITSSPAAETALGIAKGAVVSVITSKVASAIMNLLETEEENPSLTPEEVARLKKALAKYEAAEKQQR
jgi:hypothetical protein